MPQAWARLPGWALWLNALRRQSCGLYDGETESRFRLAWRKSGDARKLIDWLRFRRELGLPPEQDSREQIVAALSRTGGSSACDLAELLVEAGGVSVPLGEIGLSAMLRCADRSPPVAKALVEAGHAVSAHAGRLADIHAGQEAWREELGDQMRQAGGAVCLVGNGASLAGAGLGARIDAHAMVIRFNRWRSPSTGILDVGSRLDAWVCAPRFLNEINTVGCALPRWLVLAGPDVRYRRAGRAVDWARLAGLLDAGVKVVTIPLPVWRQAVAELGAPPSSGLLMLVWARALLGGRGGCALAGFDGALAYGSYHHAGRAHSPGRRHAWAKEAELLQSWIGEDVARIADPVPPG